jgi:hypothetical protein
VTKLQAEMAAAATKAGAKEANAVSLPCLKKREKKQQVRADNNKILEGPVTKPHLFVPSFILRDAFQTCRPLLTKISYLPQSLYFSIFSKTEIRISSQEEFFIHMCGRDKFPEI